MMKNQLEGIPTRYSIYDLGPSAGSHDMVAINEGGEVVITSKGQTYLYYYESKERISIACPSSFDHVIGSAINDTRQIVGYAGKGGIGTFAVDFTIYTALLWDGGETLLLGNPYQVGSRVESRATDINNEGQIVGGIWAPSNSLSACVWSPDNRLTELYALPNQKYSMARAINNKGQIVGSSGRAVLWQDGGIVDLAVPEGRSSCACDINDRGEITGNVTTYDGIDIPFLHDGSRIKVLNISEGGSGQARSINNLSQIVGTIEQGDYHGYRHAFLWQNGTIFDLNKFIPLNTGWHLLDAVAINDVGQIVGEGVLRPVWSHCNTHISQGNVTLSGKSHAFLLTPVSI